MTAVPVYNTDMEDIFEWLDGTWCRRFELGETTPIRAGYRVLPYNSLEWQLFMGEVDIE